MKREPIEETKRKPFTKAEKVAILAKSGGHCSYPGCASTDRIEYDHIIQRWLGGPHTIENGQALCYGHHKQKSALDTTIRSKTKRIHKTERGEKKPTTIRSRPFPPGKRPFPKRPK
jgi:hypothetical protein